MKKTPQEIWFPAIKYGMGWGLPVKWQGWVVLVSYLILMVAGGMALTEPGWKMICFPIYTVSITGLFVFICWKKGASPELRWGSKKDT